MLIVTRKLNETLTIHPIDGLDPNLTLAEAFGNGFIEITLLRVSGRRVRLAVEAPPQLRIWRSTHDKPADVPQPSSRKTKPDVDGLQVT